MVRLAQKTLAVLLLFFTQVLPAAEEPQALKEATAAHKEPLRALIAQAAKEGEVSHLDAVIQPDTNAALVTAFRKYYGLPADFKVNYSLVATASLVTRVDQEVSAGHVTMDIVENEAMISGRSGFVSPVPAYAPAIENLNVIKVDWEKMTAADMTKARDEWLSIFNP